MALLFDPIEARIVAVMEQARGSALSADAQARAIPAGWYRRAPGGASVRDAGLELAAFDRCYSIDWESIGATPEPNGLDGTGLRDLRGVLLVGMVYGADAAAFVHLAPSSTEARPAAVAAARKRLLSDAERIARALTFSEIVTGSDIDPEIVMVRRDGPAALEDLGGGRLVCAIPLVLTVQLSNTTSYLP